MAKLIKVFVLCLLLSCDKDSDNDTVKQSFSFVMYIEDHTRFNAKVYWGVNKLEFNEVVNDNAFSKTFWTAEQDLLFITVESNSIKKRIVMDVDANTVVATKKVFMSANTLYQIKPPQ